MRSKRQFISPALVIVPSIVAIIVMLWPTTPDRWDEDAKAQTIARAEPLIAALEQCISDHDAPPQHLDDLVPDYLDQLPTPIVGQRRWTYRLSKYGYQLHVESSDTTPPPLILMMIFGPYGFDDRALVYYRSAGKWEMADL
jgi:hypothetical protein